MVKFGVSIYSISKQIRSGELSPAEGVKWLADNGAEVVELLTLGTDILSQPEWIGAMQRASEKAGIPIVNFSLGANFLRISPAEFQDEIARVKAHIDALSALNLPTMRIDCAGGRPIESTATENFQRELPMILQAYRELCDHAKQYDLKILIENHGLHANGAERIRQIMTSIDRENFGHQLDVGNYACVDDIPEIAVTKVLPFATTIHMKDFYIRDRNPGDAPNFDCSGSWFRSVSGRYLRGSILGHGDLDIYKIMKSIKQSGFDGNMLIEFEGIENCLYGAKVSLDNMKRIYSEV